MLLAVIAAASISLNISHVLNRPKRTPSVFHPIDGHKYEAKYVYLGQGDELHMRYSSFFDSGVELERVVNGKTAWVAFMKPLNTEHTDYSHTVRLESHENEWKESGEIEIRSMGSYGTILERRDLRTGKLLDRSVNRWAAHIRHHCR